jgi:hypothetical protein
MTNNNLADISTFEQLQAEQNAKTGMSQMSVFNIASLRQLGDTAEQKIDDLETEFHNKYGHLGWQERGRERQLYKYKMQDYITKLDRAIDAEKKRIKLTGTANKNSQNKDEQDIAYAELKLNSAKGYLAFDD